MGPSVGQGGRSIVLGQQRRSGHKGVDEPLYICLGEFRPEFGNVFEVVNCGLVEVIDVGVIAQLLVHFNTDVVCR